MKYYGKKLNNNFQIKGMTMAASITRTGNIISLTGLSGMK